MIKTRGRDKMKTYFQYQKIWIRVFGFIPIDILVYLIQMQLFHKLLLPDSLIYIINGLIMILFLSIYCKSTEKYNWYIRSGEYWVDKDTLIFNIKGKLVEIKFCDINEILIVKNNLVGSHHTILLIKWNKEKLKLISTPITKETEIYETEFMEIFKLVKTYCTNLDVVKDLWGNDTDYWLKNL